MESTDKPQRKIAVVTCFPNSNWNLCTAEMLASFKAYWPEDIKIYIQLDEQPAETFNELNNAIIDILGEGRAFIAGLWDEDQKSFMERWKHHVPQNYKENIVGFSHKVFALEKCADAVKEDIDVLIWLDDDVITKKNIDREWLETVLPSEDEVASYLGREGFHSECGFVAYNLKNGGYDLLLKMKNEYVLGNFSDYKTGVTDCHVFDFCRSTLLGGKFKNLSPHYIKDVSDINVWLSSKLAERLVHRKGSRKVQAAQNREQVKNTKPQTPVIDVDNMNVKTRNCLDHEKIKANVQANLSQIRVWATICRPGTFEEKKGPVIFVTCSASTKGVYDDY